MIVSTYGYQLPKDHFCKAGKILRKNIVTSQRNKEKMDKRKINVFLSRNTKLEIFENCSSDIKRSTNRINKRSCVKYMDRNILRTFSFFSKEKWNFQFPVFLCIIKY